jgi:flagellar hook-length control protein FliK
VNNEMVSALQINGSNPLLQGVGGEGGGLETGGFDFMNYLLGLQTPSLDLMTPEMGGPMSNLPHLEGGEAEDPLAGLFEKKGGGSWNPMFPSETSMNSALVAPKDSSQLLAQTDPLSRDSSSLNADAALKLGNGKLNGAQIGSEQARFESVQSTDDFLRTHAELSNQPTQGKHTPEMALNKYNKVDAQTGENEQKIRSEEMDKYRFQGASSTAAHRMNETEAGNEGHVRLENRADISREIVEPEKRQEREDLEIFDLAGAKLGQAVSAANDGSAKVEEGKSQAHSLPEVFQKVESMVHHGGGKMTVALNPKELGHMEIEVTTRGKNVEISVKSENDFAKSAIEGKISELRHSIQSQDLHLSKMEVHVSREGFKADLGGSGFQGNPNRESQSFSRSSQGENPWRNQESIASSRLSSVQASSMGVRAMSAGNGRVDLRI